MSTSASIIVCCADIPPYPSMRSERLGSLSAGVGKSCLLLRFSEDSFTSSFITTIGCATASATRAVVTPESGVAAHGTDGGRGKILAGLTSKSRRSCWTTNGSSCKSGTRPARSASGRSRAVRSPSYVRGDILSVLFYVPIRRRAAACHRMAAAHPHPAMRHLANSHTIWLLKPDTWRPMAQRTTAARWASCWCTTLRTRPRLTTSGTG